MARESPPVHIFSNARREPIERCDGSSYRACNLIIDVKRKLAALLAASLFSEGSLSEVKLVAGEGLEPPTPGL
jgi:hypothetical protein